MAAPSIPSVPGGVELLSQPWYLSANNGASEKYQGIPPTILAGKDTIRITYDLHGLSALGADASAIIFDQNGWQYISLSDYGQNGKNGVQSVDIPLARFSGLNLNGQSNTIHTRFWYGSAFTVDIYSIILYTAQTVTPTVQPSATLTFTSTFLPTAIFTAIPLTLPPTVNALLACPSGTGPNNIRAGGYDPFRLTQDERQWLFNIFGNSGTAPVGYGGQPCGTDYGSGTQNFFAMVCARGDVGPIGIRPGGYDATGLTQDQRQWLWNEFRESGGAGSGISPVGYGGQSCPNGQQLRICPAGIGPGGIPASSYDPTSLTQSQRQWLWEQFGFPGTAPVGYGGTPCTRPTPTTPPQPAPCPPGVGAPGSFDPTTLTQQQRNELFWAFLHTGTAPVGYGGETCSSGTMTLPSFANGNTASIPLPTPQNAGTPVIPIDNGNSLPIGVASVWINASPYLNIRSGPSNTSPILAGAANGRYFEVIGIMVSGWYPIKFSGGAGWINEGYAILALTPDFNDSSVSAISASLTPQASQEFELLMVRLQSYLSSDEYTQFVIELNDSVNRTQCALDLSAAAVEYGATGAFITLPSTADSCKDSVVPLMAAALNKAKDALVPKVQ